jgi:hypothetical protein
LIADNV